MNRSLKSTQPVKVELVTPPHYPSHCIEGIEVKRDDRRPKLDRGVGSVLRASQFGG